MTLRVIYFISQDGARVAGNSDISDVSLKGARILPWPKRVRSSVSELRRLLQQDKELAEFFRFVDKNGLRERASELLNERMSKAEKNL